MLNNPSPLTASEFAIASFLRNGPCPVVVVLKSKHADPVEGFVTREQINRWIDDNVVRYAPRTTEDDGDSATPRLRLTETAARRYEIERAYRVAAQLSAQQAALLCLAAVAGARRGLGDTMSPSADASRVLTRDLVGLGVVDSHTYQITDFGRMVLAAVAD